MRLLVCGGRDWTDTEIYAVLDELHEKHQIEVIIEGDARDADRMAGYWARKSKIRNLKFRAEREMYGKKADSVRNQQMLFEGKPDLVLAFPGDTEDMLKRARKAGVKILQIE